MIMSDWDCNCRGLLLNHPDSTVVGIEGWDGPLEADNLLNSLERMPNCQEVLILSPSLVSDLAVANMLDRGRGPVRCRNRDGRPSTLGWNTKLPYSQRNPGEIIDFLSDSSITWTASCLRQMDHPRSPAKRSCRLL